MNKKKYLIFLFLLFLLPNCSFDTKTGIWSGAEDEKKRIIEEKEKDETMSWPLSENEEVKTF